MKLIKTLIRRLASKTHCNIYIISSNALNLLIDLATYDTTPIIKHNQSFGMISIHDLN